MKVRFVRALLLGFVCIQYGAEGSVSAQSVVYTSMMRPHKEAQAGLRDLVDFLDNNGLRTTALKHTLPHLVLHREGSPSAGVLLAKADDGFTVTTARAWYRGVRIVVTDKKSHSILRKTTIDALVDRNFAAADNPNSPVTAAISELLHAFIAHSHCFSGSARGEDALVNALTAHLVKKIGVGSLAQRLRKDEARRRQLNLTVMVSGTLTKHPAWERCYAALGHLFVDVDFDVLPTGEPVPEGLMISNQYIMKGAAFSIADTLVAPDLLISDNASDEINRFYHGMSLSNVLTNRGFSPGPSGSLGCESDMRVSFLDPATQQPTTVRSASLRWFAGVIEPVPTPLPVRLIAKNRQGKIVASDKFRLQELSFAPASFTLSVRSGKTNIASIETQGITGNGICVAFDNLAFWPPLH